jgi:hypothetical protein
MIGRRTGAFAGGLFGGWIRAWQAVGADANETVQLLLAWMDDDPYGLQRPGVTRSRYLTKRD